MRLWGLTASKSDRAKDKRLKLLYRISLVEHKKIKEFQEQHPVYKLLLGKLLGTDHDHKTGQVRGLLDWRINRAYEKFVIICGNRLPEVLRALAIYHEHPPAELALGEKRYGLIGSAKVKKVMTYGPPKKVNGRSKKK